MMRISVVIPLHNEEKNLPHLIEAIMQQSSLPAEIILVDAWSTDKTGQIIHAASESFPIIKPIAVKLKLNPGETRNLGFLYSTCEWVVFLDAEHYPSADWILNLTKCTSGFADIVFSNRRLTAQKTRFQVFDLLYEPIGFNESQAHFRNPKVSSTMMRREVFEKLGKFNNWRSGEDKEFLSRIIGTSLQTNNCTDATVYVQPASSLLELLIKQKTYAWHNSSRLLEGSHKRVLFYVGIDIVALILGLYIFPLYFSMFLFYSQRFMRLVPRMKKIRNLLNSDFHATLKNWFLAPFVSAISDYFVLTGVIFRRLGL
jgi:glycosyltransferase involved in cell wall biosynthesis